MFPKQKSRKKYQVSTVALKKKAAHTKCLKFSAEQNGNSRAARVCLYAQSSRQRYTIDIPLKCLCVQLSINPFRFTLLPLMPEKGRFEMTLKVHKQASTETGGWHPRVDYRRCAFLCEIYHISSSVLALSTTTTTAIARGIKETACEYVYEYTLLLGCQTQLRRRHRRRRRKMEGGCGGGTYVLERNLILHTHLSSHQRQSACFDRVHCNVKYIYGGESIKYNFMSLKPYGGGRRARAGLES